MRNVQSPSAIVMAASGKTFYRAAQLLPKTCRASVIQLYSFCRHVDDIADESKAPVSVRFERLLVIEESLLGTGTPEIARSYGWTKELSEQLDETRWAAARLVRAVRGDLAQQQPASELALEEYAFGVAGTVGVMLCELLGAGPAGRSAATHLGIAMQLSNIARDVAQDFYHGRIYLPASYLHAADLEHALLLHDPAARKRLIMATSRLLALSESHYECAFDGIHTLPWRVRWSILAAALCYREIGIKTGRNVSASWGGRTKVSSARKLWLTALAGLRLFQPRFWRRRAAVFATNLPVIS